MNTMNRVSGISKKYDSALDYGITMYDELPYKRNADVCNGSTVALYSGHIIKYYLCNNEEDCFLIDNHDDEIGQILLDIQQQNALREISEPEPVATESLPLEEITEEQMQNLLEDNDEESKPQSLDDKLDQIVNLDDIEDW